MPDSAAGTRIRTILLVIASAMTLARALAPFEVGKDQSLQLEAAARLAQGRGLTSTYYLSYDSFDLAAPPTAKPLTWWPPGFPLLIAGLLASGLPLLLLLKSLYAAVTLIGWAGWAPLLREALAVEETGRAQSVGQLIAALLPIFYTPWWGGTDLFLWAGLPFVLGLLYRGGRGDAPAGLLLGALYAMRWSSLFVAPVALLVIAQTSWPDRPRIARRALLFGAALALGCLPTFLWVRARQGQGVGLPAYLRLADGARTLPGTLRYVLGSLPVASDLALGHPLVEDLVMYKLRVAPLSYAVGLGFLLVLLALPLLLLATRRAAADRLAGLAWLPASLMAMLITMGILAPEQQQLEHRRFHMPVKYIALLAWFQLATARRAPRFVRGLAIGALALFFGYNLLYQPARLLSPAKRYTVVQAMLSFTPARVPNYASTSAALSYPGNRLYSLKENSREAIRALHAQSPDAVFLIDNYSFYVYDNFAGTGLRPGDNLRRLPGPDFWREAYASRPMKLYWVLERDDAPAHGLSPAQWKPVFRDRSEKTFIFESSIPAGMRFIG